jgi:hypothetical protein
MPMKSQLHHHYIPCHKNYVSIASMHSKFIIPHPKNSSDLNTCMLFLCRAGDFHLPPAMPLQSTGHPESLFWFQPYQLWKENHGLKSAASSNFFTNHESNHWTDPYYPMYARVVFKRENNSHSLHPPSCRWASKEFKLIKICLINFIPLKWNCIF